MTYESYDCRLQEEDYLEAEIESSDTLVPNLTEQFGQSLLQSKYINAATSGGAANANADDAAAVAAAQTTMPGAVPRRQGGASSKPPQLGGSRKRGGGGSGKSTAAAAAAPPPSPPRAAAAAVVDDRTLSMSSQHTYILQNDKRKPLVVASGIQAGTRRRSLHQLFTKLFCSFSCRRAKIDARRTTIAEQKDENAREVSKKNHILCQKLNIKKRYSGGGGGGGGSITPTTARRVHHAAAPHVGGEPTTPTTKNAPSQATLSVAAAPIATRRKSDLAQLTAGDDDDDDERVSTAETITKSSSTNIINELASDAAPIATPLHSRIPQNADPNHYVAAFGSRPKITRTPTDHKTSAY